MSGSGSEIVRRGKTQLRLAFDPEKTALHALIDEINQKYRIRELSIEHPSIEDVVARLYKQVGSRQE